MATPKKSRVDARTVTPLSRREFGALTVSAMAAPFALTGRVTVSPPISATDVIDRIKKNVGVEWKPDTFDAIKAGDPATAVSGVVTTAIASMSVLRRAVDAGANLIITSEPTFYGRNDARTPPAGRGGRGAPPPPDAPPPSDPVYTAKNAFIEKHGLVVFRLNEHWRLRRPDPFATGLASALGWNKRVEAPGDVLRYSIGAASLSALAAELKKKLGARGGIRVIGDPQTRVQTVGLLPGSTPSPPRLTRFRPSMSSSPAKSASGSRSSTRATWSLWPAQEGLMLIGRIVSEEPGMSVCADWLKTLVSEVPVRHIPAGDPYWRPVMTAGEVVDRIKKNLGAPWRDTTYRDTFKFGGPDTVVTGIATTMFVTLDVIKRAAAAGLNMIIPHEDTFWNDRDDMTIVSRDPLTRRRST